MHLLTDRGLLPAVFDQLRASAQADRSRVTAGRDYSPPTKRMLMGEDEKNAA